MIGADLLRRVLVAPSKQMDRLSIISGYASAGFAKRNLEEARLPDESIPCNIELVVGMISQDGLNKKHHTNFQALAKEYPNFSCRYVVSKPPIHSKLYIWSRGKCPVQAWAGSANYTHAGFADGIQGNILSEVDPNAAMSYFRNVRRGAVDCLTVDVPAQLKLYERKEEYEDISEFESKDLSLVVRRNGEVPVRSGLNWGQRPGRNPNQAYIPVASAVAQSGFFPARGEKFTMETDDDKFFICCIAQDNGKAIHTTYDNSQLGKYFRERLSVPAGALVTKRHLEKYGRDGVTISKISHDHYFMDFSPRRGQHKCPK